MEHLPQGAAQARHLSGRVQARLERRRSPLARRDRRHLRRSGRGQPRPQGRSRQGRDLADVKLVELEPDYPVIGWWWAEGYGARKEGYWLLPRRLTLSDGSYIDFQQLKKGEYAAVTERN